MRPLERSSVEDIAIWFDGGGVARARFIRAPLAGGEAALFDMRAFFDRVSARG